ncbi:MAG: hypothetical protein E7661_00825 [Ruminococcaceae bacterium]|nr:hypothetical protein [Oscillospiraceae bacterium]
MTDLIKQIVRETIENKMCAWQKKPDGYYHEEIYADYRDEMEDSTLKEIMASEDPEQTFYEKMFEWYQDAEWEIESNLLEAVVASIETAAPTETYDEDEIKDEIRELVSIDYPYEHFLKQEFCVNIFVDTGDGNYDYVLNCVYPHYNGRYGETINDRASIVWLARQQGYTKTELNKALREGDIKDPKGFLESMRQEVINHGSHMGILTFLARMTLEEIFELNELLKLQDRNGHFYDAEKRPYCGYILIDKKAKCGLYDPWGGGGSILELQLEKDVRLPIRFIRSATVDGGDGCSIRNVYGTDSSIYREDVVKKIHAPKKV